MLLQALRYALRLARRTPFLTTVVLFVLAGGIAITTAVFGLVNAAWLRPLPYPGADRLVVLGESHPRLGPASLFSPASYQALLRTSGWAEGVGAFSERSFALGRAGAHAERVRGLSVAPALLGLLAARPLAGRAMTADDARPGAEPAALVSERFWRRYAGGERSFVGSLVRLDGVETRVVGVLPYAFRLLNSAFDVFTPLSSAPSVDRGRSLLVVARLPPGVGRDSATARLDALAWGAGAVNRAGEPGWKPLLRPLDQVMWGEARPAFLLLLAAALLLLALITANVSNLLLARSEARREEFAIRLALGAGRAGLLRHLVVEGLLLALLAAALAIILCLWLQSLLIAAVPEMTDLRLDSRVFAFASSAAIVAGLAFGFLPAWSVLRRDVVAGLRPPGASGSTRRRTGRLLAASQLAAAAALLTCCGLLVRGAFAVRGVRPGFDTERLLTASVSLPESLYGNRDAREAFYRELAARVTRLPGVRSMALTTTLPLDGGIGHHRIEVEGRTGSDERMRASRKSVSEAYADTLGVATTAGERLREAAATEVVINGAMAKALWKKEEKAVGARVRVDDGPWLAVAGVVSDARQVLNEPAAPEIQLPFFADSPAAASLLIRTAADPLLVAPGLTSAVRSIDADVPVSDVWPMTAIVDSYFPRPFLAAFVLLSVIALLLSALGLYAVVSFHVARRTREFGIRVALGADARRLLLLVVWEGLHLTAVGLVVGGLAGAALGRVLASRFTEVQVADPWLALTVTSMLGVVSAAACLLPARRASRLEPSVALRWE